MKQKSKNILFKLVMFLSVFFVLSCTQEDDKKTAKKNTNNEGPMLLQSAVPLNELSVVAKRANYICPMHSHVVSKKPGVCPICGMALVKKSVGRLSDNNSVKNSGNQITKKKVIEYPQVIIDGVISNNLAIKYEKVQRGDWRHKIETLGKITRVDPMARSRITSPIKGHIVSISDKGAGDLVSMDEFLFSVSSAELEQIELEYRNAYHANELTRANVLLDKLVKMGINPEQIAELQSNQNSVLAVKINAKEDGYIFSKRGYADDEINRSFTVFNLAGNYQVIEVTAEIFERQWGLVKEGQNAKMVMRNLPGEVFNGIIDRVDEPVGYTTRALEVRIKFKTDRKGLSQSTFARVFIDGKKRSDIITVPRDAVIRTMNSDRVVKILANNHFQPVDVLVGEEVDDRMEILSGLKEGELIVTSGQFLIDSESSLQRDIERMSDQIQDQK